MTLRLGMLAAIAMLAGVVGCASTTELPVDTGVVVDGGTPGDTGPPIDAARDAARPDAPRPDAGMCVDGLPDPTRPVPTQCMTCRPPGGAVGMPPECTGDADCNDTTMGSNGRCVFGRIGAFCSYDACFADTDCEAGEICLCDGGQGGGNTCVPADCHVDTDCGAGFTCSPTFGTCGHYFGFVGFRCHRPADTCTVDADCGLGYCAFDELMGHWACSTSECAG